MKVLSVSGQPDADTHGNLSAWITVEGVEGSVLLRKKAPFPHVGDDISDDYRVVEKVSGSTGKPYKKLERPQQQGGGGGPRPEDPKRAARILRQHSQDMALRYCQLQHERGKLPEDFKLGDLVSIVDWFDRDAEAAAR